MSRCVLCEIFGKVQGVWYRAGAQQQAERRGVVGYARNRADGSVEVLACADEETLRGFKDWLWEGPPMAVVTDILCRASDSPSPETFEIG